MEQFITRLKFLQAPVGPAATLKFFAPHSAAALAVAVYLQDIYEDQTGEITKVSTVQVKEGREFEIA